VAGATNTISFSAVGVSGSFVPASPVAASGGVASSSFTPSTIGNASVTASSAGLTSATVALTVTAGAPARLALAPASGSAATGAPVSYTATVLDANGNTVSSSTDVVTFSVSGVSGSFNPSSVAATAGIASSIFAASTAGTATITASSAGLISASATLSISQAAGVPAKLTLTPASSSTQIGMAVSYTATIEDINGNPVATATNPITFVATSVSGSFNPASPVVASGGVARSAFSPASAGTGTITVSSPGLSSASATLAVSTPASGQSLFTVQTPSVANTTDSTPYELGMKFRVARSGLVTAIRYWKAPSEVGTHIGRIWSSAGVQLASVTFSNETDSGWQEQALAVPLSIQPNLTYVVSVNATYFAVTPSGLALPVINGDISSVADGANGVFGGAGVFPANSFQNSNYFRDIVFAADPIGPPAKLVLTPASSTSVIGVPVSYTASVQDANGNVVSTATNSISFSVSGVSGSFNPSSLITAASGAATAAFTATNAGTGTITVSSPGLASASAALTVVSAANLRQSLFTTQLPALTTASEQTPYELGMKFRLNRSGQIASIRYWKSPSETGVHIGKLWSANGALLASTDLSLYHLVGQRE